MKKHITYIANGLGGQSIVLAYMAGQGMFDSIDSIYESYDTTYPVVSISADTGDENDKVLNTGERISSRAYFYDIFKPLADKWNLPAYFVRSKDKNKVSMPSISEYALLKQQQRLIDCNPMPMFTTRVNKKTGRTGRLRQSCTQRWKLTAINQCLRELGAASAISLQGIHYGEAWRRINTPVDYVQEIDTINLFNPTAQLQVSLDKIDIYHLRNRTIKVRDSEGNTVDKIEKFVKWQRAAYPLAQLKLDRDAVRAILTSLGIPFLVSTECDCCPHKDLSRWLHTSDETILQVEQLENQFAGQFFFTPELMPLRQAIQQMKEKAIAAGKDPYADAADFGCGNTVCGI